MFMLIPLRSVHRCCKSYACKFKRLFASFVFERGFECVCENCSIFFKTRASSLASIADCGTDCGTYNGSTKTCLKAASLLMTSVSSK